MPSPNVSNEQNKYVQSTLYQMLDTVAHSSVGAAFGALAGRLISTLSVKQAAITGAGLGTLLGLAQKPLGLKNETKEVVLKKIALSTAIIGALTFATWYAPVGVGSLFGRIGIEMSTNAFKKIGFAACLSESAIAITNFFISNRDPKTSGPDNTNSPEEISTNTSTTTNNQTPADNSQGTKRQKPTGNVSTTTSNQTPGNTSSSTETQPEMNG